MTIGVLLLISGVALAVGLFPGVVSLVVATLGLAAMATASAYFADPEGALDLSPDLLDYYDSVIDRAPVAADVAHHGPGYGLWTVLALSLLAFLLSLVAAGLTFFAPDRPSASPRSPRVGGRPAAWAGPARPPLTHLGGSRPPAGPPTSAHPPPPMPPQRSGGPGPYGPPQHRSGPPTGRPGFGRPLG